MHRHGAGLDWKTGRMGRVEEWDSRKRLLFSRFHAAV